MKQLWKTFVRIEINMAHRTSPLWARQFRRFFCGAAVLGFVASAAWAEDYLYRYENEKGVKVINHTIPPEYAQKGYEVLSSYGSVIKVVDAAPTDGDITKENSERMLREKFSLLKRRYGSIDDIEAAKLRRLKNIDTNISILRGNIGSVNTRIENLMSQAADMERAGRNVPDTLLRQLSDTKAELAVSSAALKARIEEFEEVSQRYDEDMATFIAGKQLIQTGSIN